MGYTSRSRSMDDFFLGRKYEIEQMYSVTQRVKEQLGIE
jgi:hypothetical protein